MSLWSRQTHNYCELSIVSIVQYKSISHGKHCGKSFVTNRNNLLCYWYCISIYRSSIRQWYHIRNLERNHYQIISILSASKDSRVMFPILPRIIIQDTQYLFLLRTMNWWWNYKRLVYSWEPKYSCETM